MSGLVKSLQQHLISCGWTSADLSRNGRDARMVGLASGEPHYEPFRFIRRLFSSRVLPLNQVVRPGMKFRFLDSLKHDIHGVGAGSASLIVKAHDAANGSNYSSEPVFLGYVDREGNPPVQSFPFGAWLTLEHVHPIACEFREDDGTRWTIVNIALTHLCDIEVQDAA